MSTSCSGGDDSSINERPCSWSRSAGFGIGDVVYAPVHHKANSVSYTLAEVTGIQAQSGTATVVFPGGEPGVDDKALPMYTLVPCPRAALPVPSAKELDRSPAVIKHIFGVGAVVPPVAPSAGSSRAASPRKTSTTCCIARPQVTKAARLGTEIPTFSVQPKVMLNGGDWTILFFYRKDEGVDAFYAHAFGTTCLLACKCRPEATLLGGKWMMLCVFTAYGTLHKFETYMTLRGYQVELVDGVARSIACEERQVPETSKARGLDFIWLCALADDVEDEHSATTLVGRWASFGKEEKDTSVSRCRGNSGIIGIIQFIGKQGEEAGEKRRLTGSYREDTVGKILISVTNAQILIKSYLCDCPDEDELQASSLAIDKSAASASAELGERCRSSVPKCSGTALELCLPVSVPQINLFSAFIKAHGMASKEEATSEEYPQCESSGGSCDSGTSPAAIQAIATGNVFSPALSAAIAASGGLKLLEGLRRRVVCDGHFLGEELSPLFCAIQAILKDTLPLQAIGNKGRWKRVVVFLPGVSGTGSSTLTYQRALQRFLYPWRLYFLAADRWLRPTAAAVIDSLSWLETGGVMLLSPEDPLSWLSYLREEAEVVIDCGAASSSKSVCRNKVVHIRLTSEIEIASDLTHPFSTWRPVRELQQHTMEEGFLGRVLAYARVSGTVTYCLRSAAALVEWFNDEHDQEGNVGPHLQQLARLLLACCCRAREGD